MIFPQFYAQLKNIHFISGATEYLEEAPYTNRNYPRIVLNASVGNSPQTLWVVDTGAPWCVIDPYFASCVDLQYEELYRLERPMMIRGCSFSGRLVKTSIKLVARWGDDLDVESTLFLPDAEEGAEGEWNIPNFLGLSGFLNHLKFAINPTNKIFYFGQSF